eukprot:scaffold96351_cov55-Phaeocystis_antarctica.AAC.2
MPMPRLLLDVPHPPPSVRWGSYARCAVGDLRLLRRACAQSLPRHDVGGPERDQGLLSLL